MIEKFRRRADRVLLAAGVLCAATIVMWPVLKSPFCGDDALDSLHPMRLKYSGQSVWSLIWEITNSWRSAQGRFFPGAVSLGVFVHQIFPDLGPYKVVQLFVVLVGLALFVYVVQLLTRSFRAAVVAGLLVVSALQFRVQYDPILQFSIQQPTLMILLLATTAFLINGVRRDATWMLVIAGLFYSCALLTYETTLLLVPMFVVMLWVEKPKGFLIRSLSVVIPAFAAGVNLAYLRASTTTTAAGYTSDLSLSKVVPTFLRQSVGALPFSYAQINTPPFIQRFPHFLDIRTARTWLLVILVVALLGAALRGLPRVPPKNLLVLAFSGLSLWLIPALVVSQTVRWQSEVVWGNAYIPVYVEYFGFSLVGLSVILSMRLILLKLKTPIRIVFGAALVILVTAGSVAASSNNRLAVQQYNPGYLWSRQFFERSISRGVFEGLENGDSVFTPGGQLWFEPAFVAWWKGPRLASIVDSIEDPQYMSCVTDTATCVDHFDGAFLQFGIFPTEIRATIVGNQFELASDGSKFTSLRVADPRIYVELLRSFDSIQVRENRCRSWAVSRYQAQGLTIPVESIDVVSSAENWCILDVRASESIDALKFTAHP